MIPNFLYTLFYFLIALILLVTVHEYGHFIVARWCGVKILRVSFGFGKILARWKSKKGTEYVFSLIPLGGYVKMLDEAEGPVPVHEQHLAFNTKSVWQRIIIVLAGPFFNFIFAFFALWAILVIGIESLAPIVDNVKPHSIAEMAGMQSHQEIIAVNDNKVQSWRDVQFALITSGKEDLSIEVKSLANAQSRTITIPASTIDSKNGDLLEHLGIKPFIPKLPPIVGKVIEGSPAQLAGLQSDDFIKQMNGKPLNSWLDLLQYVKSHPNQIVTLSFMRENHSHTAEVIIGSKKDSTEGFVGIQVKNVDWPPSWLRLQQENPLKAIPIAFHQTTGLISATFGLIKQLVVGKISSKNLSGPVGIAQSAGESARNGYIYYLSFLALLSISLGVLNLLPIPTLDGGHLLFYLLEIVKRRPLSERAKAMGTYLGLFLLIILMVVSFNNDLSRLINS